MISPNTADLVERIKQLRAERKRYFDVEGDGVDLVLADCHAEIDRLRLAALNDHRKAQA